MAKRGERIALQLDGKSLLQIAVELVRPFATEILIGLREDQIAAAQQLFNPNDVKLVAGGPTRLETVYNLLQATDLGHILVHDAVRPIASAALCEAVLSELEGCGAITVWRRASGIRSA